jgi:hypothetical protein
MARNERAKRKQEEKRKRKREEAKKAAKAQALPTSPAALVELAAEGSFGPAWATAELGDDLQMPKLATVIVTRKLPRGQWLAHVMLVDRTCLGVKDGYLLGPRSLAEITDAVGELGRRGDALARCEPEWARSIVFHGLDFAATLGFSPHADFVQAMVRPRPDPLLDTPLGRPSRPVYWQGPRDDSDRILAQLVDRVGRGGFDFFVEGQATGEEWDDDEWDDDEPLVITAPRPPDVLPNVPVGPGLLAWTIVRRYVHELSGEQQAATFAEHGLPYDADDVDDWCFDVAMLLEPLADAIVAARGGETPADGDGQRTDDLDVEGTFATLLRACIEPRIDPQAYLRDLLCLLPEWSPERIGELAPARWRQTVAEEPARGMLERHVLRRVASGEAEDEGER